MKKKKCLHHTTLSLIIVRQYSRYLSHFQLGQTFHPRTVNPTEEDSEWSPLPTIPLHEKMRQAPDLLCTSACQTHTMSNLLAFKYFCNLGVDSKYCGTLCPLCKARLNINAFHIQLPFLKITKSFTILLILWGPF